MKLNELKLDKDKMYFLAAGNMGDTLILCGLLKALERKYNSKIVLLIRPSHKVVAEMCKTESFIICDFDNNNQELLFELSFKCPKPQKGRIYIVHGRFHREVPNLSRLNFRDCLLTFLNLEKTVKYEFPEFNFPLSPQTENKFKDIAPMDKIVLFMPEARSVDSIRKSRWEEEAIKLQKEGYTVISAVLKKENTIKNTIYMDLTLNEALEVAYNCKAVYALRSGFSDLCYRLKDKLTVFYPTYESFSAFNFRDLFPYEDVNEITEEIVPESIFGPAPKTVISILGIPIITLKHSNTKTFIKIFGLQLFKIQKLR